MRRTLDDERSKLVEFLRLLAEVDVRRLYAPMGFSSLFNLCVEGLGLSSDQAYRRVAAARVGRRFPMVLRMIEEGAQHMSGVAVLAKHLDEGGEALIEAAAGKSKVEIEALVSTLDGAPQPTVTVRVVVSPGAEALWRRAKALSGEEAGAVFEAAIAQYVERLEKQKFKTTERPRSEPEDAEPGRRPIAAAVKRAVTERDGHRCTFVGDGRRCSETERLEFDHVVPVAKGGRSTVDNVRLRAARTTSSRRSRCSGARSWRRGALPCQVKARRRQCVPCLGQARSRQGRKVPCLGKVPSCRSRPCLGQVRSRQGRKLPCLGKVPSCRSRPCLDQA
ncbi:MAG: hypothetical protein RIT81_45020 [Deltaproteobacteria bacterium]